MEDFWRELESEEVTEYVNNSTPMVVTTEEEHFSQAMMCWICDKVIQDTDGNLTVCDHDHVPGPDRGAVHQACNIKHLLVHPPYSRDVS